MVDQTVLSLPSRAKPFAVEGAFLRSQAEEDARAAEMLARPRAQCRPRGQLNSQCIVTGCPFAMYTYVHRENRVFLAFFVRKVFVLKFGDPFSLLPW